jgi:hypothetical protein
MLSLLYLPMTLRRNKLDRWTLRKFLGLVIAS